jgi:hypothetical protein
LAQEQTHLAQRQLRRRPHQSEMPCENAPARSCARLPRAAASARDQHAFRTLNELCPTSARTDGLVIRKSGASKQSWLATLATIVRSPPVWHRSEVLASLSRPQAQHLASGLAILLTACATTKDWSRWDHPSMHWRYETCMLRVSTCAPVRLTLIGNGATRELHLFDRCVVHVLELVACIPYRFGGMGALSTMAQTTSERAECGRSRSLLRRRLLY